MPQQYMGAARHSAGFSLIEVTVIVVVLGALAMSVAVRMVGLRSESHRAVVFATAGVFASAASMAQHACILRNWFGRDNMPGYADGTVDFSPTCLPASTNNANGPVNNARCIQIWNAILATAPSINAGAALDTEFRGQGSGNLCTYTYKQDPLVIRSFTYSTQTGAIVINNP